ncbi:unnamed protein product [Linum trigynum]|uniref:Uncharacterized protein n=1 Tax=Linum trigynum TaxID=586398 RepID=A0AAV2F1T6_9ROSI
MSPRLSNNSVGNLVTTALASCKDTGNNVTMKELVGLLREGMARIVDEKYINAISDAEHGFEAMLESNKILGECGSGELMTCSSWIGFGTNRYDFGWGKPLWTGLYGDPSGDHPYANNFLVFKELGA